MSDDLFDSPPGEPSGMRASELVAHLTRLIQEHGDLPVMRWTVSKGVISLDPPVVAFRRKVLIGGTNRHVAMFWQSGFDAPETRGDPVFRV